MSSKRSSALKDTVKTSADAPTVREYQERFNDAKRGGLENEKRDYRKFANLSYDLVTDFDEYGWGRSFHFPPVPGKTLKASHARHEDYLAHVLEPKPGMVVADLGCGTGGPLIEIACFSAAKIVGIKSNAYQIERARQLTDEAGLDHLDEYMHCDFLEVDAP